MNKLKDFLNLYVGIVLLSVSEEDSLIDNYSNDLTKYHEIEIQYNTRVVKKPKITRVN